MLAKQVHDTGIEVAAHTGTKEFDAYVEGSEGQALMHDLTTVAFYGVNRSLADHWGWIFTGSYSWSHDEGLLRATAGAGSDS